MTWVAAKELNGEDFIFNTEDVDRFLVERRQSINDVYYYPRIVWKKDKLLLNTTIQIDYHRFIDRLKALDARP